MEQSKDLRPLVKNMRIASRAALHPGESNDPQGVAEARRYLEALTGLELFEAIIELRTKSPAGGFPDIWA